MIHTRALAEATAKAFMHFVLASLDISGNYPGGYKRPGRFVKTQCALEVCDKSQIR